MSLLFADHGEMIGNAVAVIRNNAAAAGLTAPVPTTPGWSVRDLVLHAGAKLRWASFVLDVGEGGDAKTFDEQGALADVAEYPDVLDWLDETAVEALNALVATPDGARVWFPLTDGEGTRESWARLLASELSVHGIDAMAARLGRAPRAEELWLTRQGSADGIDLLLRGIVPNRGSELAQEEGYVLAVLPDDLDRAVTQAAHSSDADIADLAHGWTVRVDDSGARAELGAADDADATITGTVGGVLAALWNRGESFSVNGDENAASAFRSRLRIG